MKMLKSLLVSVFVLLLCSHIANAQTIRILIDSIVANSHITGTVINLDPSEYVNYKIVVYVHTDQWYIHPFAVQVEGKSWASIQKDGSWQIETVQREFRADKVAAVLVKRNYPEPNKTQSLETIQKAASIVKDLQGTPDYGKL